MAAPTSGSRRFRALRRRSAVLLAGAALALSGCGQKGPLVLPAPAKAASAPTGGTR